MNRVARLLGRDVLGVRTGVLVLVLPVVVASMVHMVQTRGLWNHPPDSRYYLTMMSRGMGYPLPASVARTRSVADWNLAPWYFSSTDPTWQMVKTRALFPVLSIPFIWVLGLNWGSMIVPTASVAVFVVVTARTLQRLYRPKVAVIVAGAFSLTGTIGYLVWATTDTLAMALAAVIVANLPLRRYATRGNLVWLATATVLIALTRQVGVLAPAMAGAGWLWAAVRERNWRNRWLGSLLVTAAAVVIVQLVTMRIAPVDTEGILARGQTTFAGFVRQFWDSFWSVSHQEVLYMWGADRLLLALLAGAVVLALLRFPTDESAVFIGAALATYLLTAGVGFSSNMRYEVIMFPAAAVAVGGLVALALGVTRVPEPEAEPEAAAEPSRRWLPQLATCTAILALVIGVSAVGASRSTAPSPPSPSVAAAQGMEPYAARPLATPPAETTLDAAFAQAVTTVKGTTGLAGPFDWVHAVRYRPTATDQPGWTHRDPDGTAVTRVNAMSSEESVAFARAITLDLTAVPRTLRVVSRTTSPFGQDVGFTVQDTAGRLHHGTATTLYPIWDPRAPGLVTALVYAP